MKSFALAIWLSGCAAIRNSTYPNHVELDLIGITPEESRVTEMQCRFKPSHWVDSVTRGGAPSASPMMVLPGHHRSDVLECSSIIPSFETWTGIRQDRSKKL